MTDLFEFAKYHGVCVTTGGSVKVMMTHAGTDMYKDCIISIKSALPKIHLDKLCHDVVDHIEKHTKPPYVMNFIQYTFKTMQAIFIALLSLAAVVALGICYLYDKPVSFLAVFLIYISLFSTTLFISFINWLRYRRGFYDTYIRELQRNDTL